VFHARETASTRRRPKDAGGRTVTALRLSVEPEVWLVVTVEARGSDRIRSRNRLSPDEALVLLDRLWLADAEEVRRFAARTDRFGDAAMWRVSDTELRQRCRRAVEHGEWIAIGDGVAEQVRNAPAARAPAAAAAPAPAPASAPPPPRERKKEPVEVEVKVLDGAGKPRKGLQFRLETPDGELMEGRLDAAGSVFTKSKEPGACRLTLLLPDDGP
jgi:hypothetical protein